MIFRKMYHYRYNSYCVTVSIRNYETGRSLPILEQRSKLPSNFGNFRQIVSKQRPFCIVLLIHYRELDLKSERSQRWNNDWRRQFGVGGRFARANRPAGGGKGTRGAIEWVIVEPGQALAAAGQERKTLLAHISSSPSLSFSRSRRSFIFIRHRLFSARRFFLSAHFFRALPHPFIRIAVAECLQTMASLSELHLGSLQRLLQLTFT